MYWQTIKPVSVTSWRTVMADRPTHYPSQRVEFMNAPKLNPLKRDWPKFTKSVNRTLYQCTPDCLSQKITFLQLVFLVRFVAKRQIGTLPLGTRWYNCYPCTSTPKATKYSVTVRQTDGQTSDRIMPIADHTWRVAVRSAKNRASAWSAALCINSTIRECYKLLL